MEKKKRRGRWSFLNDFKLGNSGQYSYMGTVYSYEGELPYKKAAVRIGILGGVIALAALAAWTIPAPSVLGINNYYVIPLMILEAIAVFVTVWGVVRFLAGGSKLRAYAYEATVKKLPIRASFAMYSALALIPANIVYLCLNGFGERPVWSAAAMALHVLIALAAFLLKRAVKAARWNASTTEEQTEGEAPEDVFPEYVPEEGEEDGAGGDGPLNDK